MNGNGAHDHASLEAAANVVTTWKYKSEGELNLVLSYLGDHAALRGKVLRITKRAIVDKAHPPSPGSTPKYTSDPMLAHFAEGSTSRDCGASFLREVIIPLLGPSSSFIHLPHRVRLSGGFMEALRSAVDPLRPLKRKSTTVIDTRDQDAYLMEDLSILYSPEPGPQPMLGVELKPKWGFLPSSPFVPEGHVKRSVCRFCMQQTLKLKEGVVHHKSDYCPLDLYSSNPTRQHHALRSLIAHPQNNIKIFMNGAVIYTGSLGGQSEATRLTHQGLAAALAPIISPTGPHDHVLDRFVELVSAALFESGVLATLAQLQAKGDAWDIEGIIKLHTHLVGMEHKGLDVFNHKLLLPLEPQDEALFGGPVSVGLALQRIRDFMQAATVKDCSLMLNFVHHNSTARHKAVMLHGRQFEYRIGIIDLDAKPIRNLPYYHKLDSEIVSQFLLAHPHYQPCRSPTPHQPRAHDAQGK